VQRRRSRVHGNGIPRPYVPAEGLLECLDPRALYEPPGLQHFLYGLRLLAANPRLREWYLP